VTPIVTVIVTVARCPRPPHRRTTAPVVQAVHGAEPEDPFDVAQGEELSLAQLVETDRVHQAELSLVADDGHVPRDAHEGVHSSTRS
jgi:hypothetical protein